MQEEERERDQDDSLLCPSFSTYSSNHLAHIANRVITHSLPQNDTHLQLNDHHHSDFEFVAFSKAADGLFFDRHDGLVFPLFNRDLAGTPPPVHDGGRSSSSEEIRLSMEKLLIGDEEDIRRSRRDPPSSSSSEVEDDLDGIPAGTYCLWTPNPVQASPNRCKKSNSTGSSSSPSPAKRWKLLDLLRRSKSDGKNSFVFLTPSSSPSSSSSSSSSLSLLRFSSMKKKEKEKKKKDEEASAKSKGVHGGGSGRNESGGGDVAGKRSPPPSPARVSAHEALYVRNREMRRVDKRRSYLPYKQDLVGFFATLNSIGGGRTFPPF